jgi:hypothetical protein
LSLGTSVIFLKLRGWSIIPLEFVKVDLFNKNPWMVDVRHFKGNIDHPIVLKKRGTSSNRAVFFCFATGNTTCHTTFYYKKIARNNGGIVLKWWET